MTEESTTLEDALEAARRLLARRGHAERELRLKLEERAFGPELIDRTIEQLRHEGAVDDARFASHQADLLQQKAWGPRRIRQKLRDRGISDTDIDDAIESLEADSPQLWLKRCVERIRQKFGEPNAEWPKHQKAKVFRHMTHRGFDKSLIRRVMFDGVRPDDDETGE